MITITMDEWFYEKYFSDVKGNRSSHARQLIQAGSDVLDSGEESLISKNAELMIRIEEVNKENRNLKMQLSKVKDGIDEDFNILKCPNCSSQSIDALGSFNYHCRECKQFFKNEKFTDVDKS